MKALAFVFLLFASTPIVIDSAKLAEGQVVLHRGGSREVTVFREGNTVTVRIAEGKRVDTIRMTRESGQLSIANGNNGEPRPLLGLDRQPVIVDGIDLEPFLAGTQTPEPRAQPAPRRHGPRFYVCPKDETMVRVKSALAPAELACPVDGTMMKAGTGRDSQIFLLD